MASLSFEEVGLLRILERVNARESMPEPSVRFALVKRGLIEAGEPGTLSRKGELVLDELRARHVRRTGE
jgi:hypothetical protein